VCHHPYPLDEEAMIQSAPLVEGGHNFTSFAAVDPEERLPGEENQNLPTGYQRSNVRTIFHSRWERRALLPWTGTNGDPAAEPARLVSPIPEADYELVYTVRGSGFLHHMVRNLVGMFLLIGKGTLTSADIPRILRAASRAANPAATAPASGLYMASVEY
jgi:tRNA pseudouridine38-40 synthase